ncbi:MAG: RDD family protein [Anaeromyxobacter sp.]
MSAPAPGERPERTREVVTPEGVPLRFVVAAAGDRVGAFALDALLIAAAMLALGLLMLLAAAAGAELSADLVYAILVLGFFLVRIPYFAFFELAWQGQTPGKRKVGIRVVDAAGGSLTSEALLVRNLTREVEVFLPLTALLLPGQVIPGAAGFLVLGSLVWMVIFGFLPLFNKDRLRVGDLVAGTLVIRSPVPRLLEDLAVARAREAVPFTDEQLDVYGVYELQVLEDVLRNRDAPGHLAAVQTVSMKVRAKIGWQGPAPSSDEAFLEAFYAALRGRLERRLLFGKRRESKHDRA